MIKKCIVFDIDGTIFDTKIGIIKALNHVLDDYGMRPIPTCDENKFIGPPINKSLADYCGFSQQLVGEATARYREKYVEKYIYDSKMYLGLIDILELIRNKGDICAIATMKTKKQVDKLVQNAGISHYFEFIETAKENGTHSKERMLAAIKEKTPLCCSYYMVGDTEGDYEAAIMNDYFFIAADYGYGNIGELQCAHITSLLDINNLIYED